MIEASEFREQTAARLLGSIGEVSHLRAFVGLDGFVDEIVHVVDKRENADSFQRLATIQQFSQRIAAAAGHSTNIELVRQRLKIGGNGPIMANALARFGVKVTYLGALGYPTLHPVFNEFARRAEVHSVAEPGHTDALEFSDGKLMLGKTAQLGEVTWANIQARYGRDRFIERFCTSDLVAFVNWTMLPFMSDLWSALLEEFCPQPTSGLRRRHLFFDLADPEKRTHLDIVRALELIQRFQSYFAVILGLNQKEACAIAEVLGVPAPRLDRDGLICLAREIQARLPIHSIVVHPTTYALAVSDGHCSSVNGPFIDDPFITTGAGDHFNAGYCLGQILGLGTPASLLTGVTSSGFYVRSGLSPSLEDLAETLRQWPEK